MTPSQADNMRQAIAIMTAWASSPDSATFSEDTLIEIVQERGGGDDLKGATDVILGFVNLSAMLLVRRFAEVGPSELETLRDLGLDLAGE